MTLDHEPRSLGTTLVLGIVEAADLLGVLARLDTDRLQAQLHAPVINR